MQEPSLTAVSKPLYFEGTRGSTGFATKEKVTPVSRGDTSNVPSIPDGTGAGSFPRFQSLVMPRAKPPVFTKETFQILQKWQGVVIDVDDDNGEFRAELIDKTDPTQPAEEATFEMMEVSLGDIDLVREGAVFYWSIGYLTDKVGTKFKQSYVKFSRLRGFSESAKAVAKENTVQLLEKLRANNW